MRNPYLQHKAVYGLKEAPQLWFTIVESLFTLKLKFKQFKTNRSVFITLYSSGNINITLT